MPDSSPPPHLHDLFTPYRAQWRVLTEIAQRRGHAAHLFGIEHLFMVAISGALLFMPSLLLRMIAERLPGHGRKISVEVYVLAKPLILAWILFTGRGLSHVWLILAVVLLADLYLSLCSLVFLRRFYASATSHSRSLLLLSVNYVESMTAFAIFYNFTGSIGAVHSGAPVAIHDPLELLYFSCITAATVGFGDMVPWTAAGRALTMLQVVSSLGFIYIFLTKFVSDFAGHRPDPG